MFLSAACTLCMALLAGRASADAGATRSGQVYVPHGPGDFSGMILSLMQRQMSLLADAEGVETEGTPANVLATLANSLMGAQQAFTSSDPVSFATTGDIPGGKPASAYDFGAPLVDPFPSAIFNFADAEPFGEELAAFFNAFPSFPDPLSFGTANFSSGTFNAGPAKNGSAGFVNFSARVFQYSPCFFQGTENVISVAPAGILVAPIAFLSKPFGVSVEPRAIEILPRIILIRPVGTNITPVGVAVAPRLISIAPKVAVLKPPGSG